MFCPTCPQPGVNLPPNWKNDPEKLVISVLIPSYTGSNYDCSREKYYRVLVIDGNFKGDHVRMRNPTDDVELTNGEGYMVEQKRYQDHLSTAKEVKQVCISDQLCCNFC